MAGRPGGRGAGRRTLADLGESALLREVFALLPAAPAALLGPGDDAAVVAAADGRVVATTDVLVEGRDFRRDWSSGEDVGWKAAAQNLADVAAMGAVPTALLVGLAAPPDTDVEWALGLCRGLAAACEGTGAGVVGGDLSAAGEIIVSVTALGDLQGRDPVRRSGARPGDVVAVAGRLGWSAAGLALLEAGVPDVDPLLVDAHRRPRPPLAAGPAAAIAGATAMLDVSDGLVRDLGRVADASGVTIDLDHDHDLVESLDPGPELDDDEDDDEEWDEAAANRWSEPSEPEDLGRGPLSLAAARLRLLAGSRDWYGEASAARSEWLYAGGEDHALAATFPPDVPLPAGFVRVGEVQPRLTGWPSLLVNGDGWGDGGGWDHFRA